MRLLSVYKSHIIVCILSIVATLLVALNFSFSLSKRDTTIEVMDMQYACGECYVNYRILKASGDDGALISRENVNFENESDPAIRFIGWDVLVFGKNGDDIISSYLEKYYKNARNVEYENCFPPHFILTGQMRRKIMYAYTSNGDMYDGTYFAVDSATAIHACEDKRTAERIKFYGP